MSKNILFFMLMFSIFSCFSKKKPPRDVESWLEQQFPGQFQVIISNLKMLDIMAQYKGDKRAVIADKADPEIQFLLNWHKDADTIGLSATTVEAAYQQSKNEAEQGKNLFKLLKNNGLDKISVGVIDQAAYIQVFVEPTPAVREQTLTRVKAALDAQPEQTQTSIFIELMEAAAYHVSYQDIIPRGAWETGAGWQKEQKIMALDFEWSAGLKTAILMRHWKLNPDSGRFGQCKDAAYQQASAWAAVHLPQPFFLQEDRSVGYDIPEIDGPAIEFGFPYFDKQPPAEASYDDPEPTGYICGLYDFDKKVFLKLRKQTIYLQ